MLFGGSKSRPQLHKGYRIHVLSLDNSYSCDFIALNQEVICQNVPSVSKGPWLQELRQKGITLTDVDLKDEPIAILIGADIAGKLLTGRRKELTCGAIAMETLLGWTLLGKTNTQVRQREDTALMMVSMFAGEASVADLWRLDTLGITDPYLKKTKDERQAEVKRNFRQTIKIDEGNRYEVLLPWKDNHLPLTDNKDTAKRRLVSTTKKLRSQELYDSYQAVFDDWLLEGIIEKVPDAKIGEHSYYLPHRHVIKESSTTKIRPVFDASAVCMNGYSLKQCLETGLNLIEQIPNILLRFRQRRIGVISDIRKAFLQIGISPEDRDVLRFLWWKKSDPHEIEVYRHRRVVFGVSSSPFLLGGTIEYHLENSLLEAETDSEKEVIRRLMKSFYVDNCITSVDTHDELLHFETVARQVMAKGKFDLRGWEYTGQTEMEERTSVLGLLWNKETDTLGLTPSLLEPRTPSRVTKRSILSAAQRVFDPIGMTSPVFLKPKLMLQALWSQKIGWDTEVSENIRTDFNEWQQQLPQLVDLHIPRRAFQLEDNDGSLTFHIFTDASQDAYAAALFARTESIQGVYIQLIMAKSRVAPVGKTTIPRLELLAATIGARLWHSVSNNLDFEQTEVFFWSDSTTVLAWIQTEKPWNTFVWNRVNEIRRLSNPAQWRHVPGSMNPADLPSRGCGAKQLIESRWWEGPTWLRSSREHWPSVNYATDEVEVDSEIKKSAYRVNKETSVDHVLVSGACVFEPQEKFWYMKRLSKYQKIVRSMAWIYRFFNNCRAPRISGELTAEEFATAELVILRLSQQESFAGMNEPRLNTLSVYQDSRGLIRLKSPIINRDDEYSFRNPVVLDPKHPLVLRLIEYRHQHLNHAGVQMVMCNLRETFWILTCRAAVIKVINRCLICKRYRIIRLEAAPGWLSSERVKDANVFEIVGIDYVGPLFLRKSQKAWVCLFTCAVYRAIHLELTTSLSTEAFLQVLRRFIARRGRPSIVYTDNGKNFVGIRNLLYKVDWNKIKQFSSVHKVDWPLNPPSAAWWGGWWERLVRIVKDLLKKTLRRACLSYEELSTILCDCEAIVNARPLSYLAEDLTQLIPLTPMMFLQETPHYDLPDLDKLTVDLNRRMRYCQGLRNEMRKRFRSEYLGQLTRRQNRSGCDTVKEGDVVLIGQDNIKRLEWPLARVVKIFPGRDGVVRVARVKTATGELVRPVQRLFPMEMSPIEAQRRA